MGYRSEVAMSFSDDAFDCLNCMLENESKETIADVLHLLYSENDYEGESETTFHYNWIKWYGSFPAVAFIEKALSYYRMVDYEYKFIRLGEEFGDVEEESGSYTNEEDSSFVPMYVTRHITFEY